LTRGEAEPIGSIIDALVAKLGIKKQLLRAQAVTEWPDIVGDRIARETKADHIRNTILFVSCSSPMWAQELGLLKPTIIKKIRERVGPGIVTDIRFKTGSI
jgi:predicted nucleic acid-binding Zn ribbon protein